MLIFIALSCIPPVLKVMKHFYNAFFKTDPWKMTLKWLLNKNKQNVVEGESNTTLAEEVNIFVCL